MGLCAEKDMNVVHVVIPLRHRNVVVWGDLLKNRTKTVRDRVIDDRAAVFDTHNQVVLKHEHRVVICIKNHRKITFLYNDH